ncbi:hypothetical protein [Paracoccus albus]|uniref:hypothetical protein n=1 Tax=Paracoccus albus TaxID=3017784 RepID=UPI003369E605
MSLWDCCAAYALIDAAGGRTAPIGAQALQGRPFGVLASMPQDFARLRDLTDFDNDEWEIGRA